MKVESSPPVDVLKRQREAVIEKWLAQTLQTYPEQSSRFLLQDEDPFRNPVGHALSTGLPVLFDEIIGSFDVARARPALEEIVRIRAVQDFTASQAVDFIFFLKSIVRGEVNPGEADLAVLDSRIDRIALLAFDLYMQCREKLHEIKVNEAKRRVYMLERAVVAE